MSERTIYTYHCLCTQLVLSSTSALETLKTRKTDSSSILPLPDISTSTETSHYATLSNTTVDQKPTVIRLEDGFEKRYMHKCNRCDLTLAYALDKSQFEGSTSESGARQDVVFVVPGGLVSTEDMKAAKDMTSEVSKVGVKAA